MKRPDLPHMTEVTKEMRFAEAAEIIEEIRQILVKHNAILTYRPETGGMLLAKHLDIIGHRVLALAHIKEITKIYTVWRGFEPTDQPRIILPNGR